MRFAPLLALLLASVSLAAPALREDTAVTILVGPIVDSADATPETGLTISQADVRLSKNGGNMAQKNDDTACTHDELGMYACPLNTTDTNTAGILTVTIGEAGTLVWSRDYTVLGVDEYDRLTGAVAQLSAAHTGLSLLTTVDTVTGQEELILTAGASNDDAYPEGATVRISGGTEVCETTVTDYVGSTKSLHIVACPFTVAEDDEVLVYVGASGPGMAAANSRLITVDGKADNIVDATSALDGQHDTMDGKLDTLVEGVNIQKVNDITIGGSGTQGDPWGPSN